MSKTALQELIEMMNESVKQYSDNAQQEAIFFALIEEAKKLLEKEKQQIIDAFDAAENNPLIFGEQYYSTTFTDKTDKKDNK